MSKKSDATFKPTKELYINWIEETYNISIKDIENEFIQFKVLGNSVLCKDDIDLIGKKLGLFGRKYTSVTELAKQTGMSRSKVSDKINKVYLKISIKKVTNGLKK